MRAHRALFRNLSESPFRTVSKRKLRAERPPLQVQQNQNFWPGCATVTVLLVTIVSVS